MIDCCRSLKAVYIEYLVLVSRHTMTLWLFIMKGLYNTFYFVFVSFSELHLFLANYALSDVSQLQYQYLAFLAMYASGSGYVGLRRAVPSAGALSVSINTDRSFPWNTMWIHSDCFDCNLSLIDWRMHITSTLQEISFSMSAKYSLILLYSYQLVFIRLLKEWNFIYKLTL